MQRPETLGLRHVALSVRDLEATEQFYVDLLGFRVDWRPDPDNVYLTLGSDNLALHRADVQGGGGALDHIGVMVPTAEAVDEWARYLTARGATLVHQPRTHRDGSRSLYVRDPAGNLVQLLCSLTVR